AHNVKENPLPAPPTFGSENIICLAEYARFFLGKDNTTEQELKHVYVALSRIVSTTALEGIRFFGHLIPEIKQGISLCDFSSPAFEVLESLKNIYLDSELDIECLLEEITLCQADLVRLGRKGGVSKAEMAKLKVKKQLYELVRYFCSMILNNQFDNKLCVAFWFHVWTVLFGQDDVILVDIGELASKATKEDIHATGVLFGTFSQSGGRKTDCLVRIKDVSCGVTSFIECGVNEHKPLHVTEAVLNQQASKVMRINGSIIARMGSEETIVFLDAHGLTAKIYGMRVFDDIYGCSGPLGKICLPTNKSI
ncbi:hypothetical protein BGX27_005005, partial [Mortierella sp. AM989]